MSSATARRHTVNFVSRIFVQGRPQLRHQIAAAGGVAAGEQFFRSRTLLPGNLLHNSTLPNCFIRDIVFTEREKQLTAKLRPASAMAPAMRGLSTRYGFGRKHQRSHERSSVLTVASVVACSLLKYRKGIETATSPVGSWENQRLELLGPGSATLWTASQNSKKRVQ